MKEESRSKGYVVAAPCTLRKGLCQPGCYPGSAANAQSGKGIEASWMSPDRATICVDQTVAVDILFAPDLAAWLGCCHFSCQPLSPEAPPHPWNELSCTI